nr:hypothetical protein [Tanacetum cinerariifolium]
QPDGSLVGTIGTQAVRLRPAAPAGGISFAVRCFTDSLAAYPKEPTTSPKARIYVQALVPTGGSAAVRQALQASFLRDLHGDTLDSAPVVPLDKLFRQQRDTLFTGYRTDVAELVLGRGARHEWHYSRQLRPAHWPPPALRRYFPARSPGAIARATSYSGAPARRPQARRAARQSLVCKRNARDAQCIFDGGRCGIYLPALRNRVLRAGRGAGISAAGAGAHDAARRPAANQLR